MRCILGASHPSTGVGSAFALIIVMFSHPNGVPVDAQMFYLDRRFDDEDLLKDDHLARYWYSVSPWFYNGIFKAAWFVGIPPVVFVKLLPLALFPLIAFFSFRFLRALEFEPIIAFIAIAFMLANLGRGELVTSGTPRAFWPLMLLVILNGLSRRKLWQTAIAQFLLTGTYPAMALVTSGLIGLSLLTPWKQCCLDFSKGRVTTVIVAAVLTVLAVMPFLKGTKEFAPTMTLDEARGIATFQHDGRGRIFEADGSIDYLCTARTGIFYGKCDGPTDPKAVTLALWYFSGPALLFFSSFGEERLRLMLRRCQCISYSHHAR